MNEADRDALIRRHLAFGWWSFFLFLVMGGALEALHALKQPWYLGPASETRRLLWTLAHAHGTLFGLMHVAFAATVKLLPGARVGGFVSWSLVAGSVLVPAGFFLGGVFVYDGDPGLGVFLVPAGAGLLALATFAIARATGRGHVRDGGVS